MQRMHLAGKLTSTKTQIIVKTACGNKKSRPLVIVLWLRETTRYTICSNSHFYQKSSLIHADLKVRVDFDTIRC